MSKKMIPERSDLNHHSPCQIGVMMVRRENLQIMFTLILNRVTHWENWAKNMWMLILKSLQKTLPKLFRVKEILCYLMALKTCLTVRNEVQTSVVAERISTILKLTQRMIKRLRTWRLRLWEMLAVQLPLKWD